MRDSVIISCYYKKDIYAVVLFKNGYVYSEEIKAFKADVVTASNYIKTITVLEESFRILRKFIEDNGNDFNFIFEINNSTVITWFNNFYSKPEYEEVFRRALDLLQELPICYEFCYNKTPNAIPYIKKGKSKSKLSGVDFLLN